MRTLAFGNLLQLGDGPSQVTITLLRSENYVKVLHYRRKADGTWVTSRIACGFREPGLPGEDADPQVAEELAQYRKCMEEGAIPTTDVKIPDTPEGRREILDAAIVRELSWQARRAIKSGEAGNSLWFDGEYVTRIEPMPEEAPASEPK